MRIPNWLNPARPGAFGFIPVLAFAIAIFAVIELGCATTPAGLKREQAAYLVTSNAVQTVAQVGSSLPAPVNGILEGATAIASALLALWASHLHRSVAELRTQNTGHKPVESDPPSPPAARGA
jgi:hypothetical protein